MSKKDDKKYKTPNGDEYEPASVVKKKVDPMDIPYPDKGGHTVEQLSEMNPDKRASILGEKDSEFVKHYLKQ